MNKIACKNFRNFLHRELCIKKSAKIHKHFFYWKNNPDFSQNFLIVGLAKKGKNENGKIHHYSLKMANDDLEIWQNHLLLKPFHMIDAKFDLVLSSISHRNPDIPFLKFYHYSFISNPTISR